MENKNTENQRKALNAYLDSLDEQIPIEPIDPPPGNRSVKEEEKVARGPNQTNG